MRICKSGGQPESYFNHPGQTIYISINLILLRSGHPSLKKGGETSVPKLRS